MPSWKTPPNLIPQKPIRKVTNKEIFDFIVENLEFDQLINEYNYSWIHVSYKSSKENRNQVLKASKVGGETIYTKLW